MKRRVPIIIERRRIARKVITVERRMGEAREKVSCETSSAPLAAEVHEMLKGAPIRFPKELV